MRVAVVDVGAAAVRSVVAEPADGGLRRVLDHSLAIPLDRGPETGRASALPGTVDLLREAMRRFRQAHERRTVDRAHLVVDGELRPGLEAGGLLDRMAEDLDARIAPSDAATEVGALVAAVHQAGALDGRPTLVVDLDGTTARVALVRQGVVVDGGRRPLRPLSGLARVAVPGHPDRWLGVAGAAVVPLVEAVGHPTMVPVVAAGPPVRSLASLVAARRGHRPDRAAERVVLESAEVAATAHELTDPGSDVVRRAGPRPDLDVVAGAAVVLAGLVGAIDGSTVLCTDAQRVDGHLLRLLGAAVPSSPVRRDADLV